jgi:hypothetical protein
VPVSETYDVYQGQSQDTDGQDAFLTIIQGAMSTFHFSTRVVRFLGERD